MAATCNVKVSVDETGEAVYPATGDAANTNLMSADLYDDTGTVYQDNPITVPGTGTNYSFERWVKLEFTGTFNKIENIIAWKSAGTLSDVELDIAGGTTTTYAAPVNTDSTLATTTLASWDAEAEAIALDAGGSVTTDGGFSDFLVMQLDVTDLVTTPGDIGTITITYQYDES